MRINRISNRCSRLGRRVLCGAVLASAVIACAQTATVQRSQTDMRSMQTVGSVTMRAAGADALPVYQADSTRRMAERLTAAFAATDWRVDPNKPQMRVQYYSALLASRSLPLTQDTTVREQLAREQLSAGDSDAAVRQLLEVQRRWSRAARTMSPELETDTNHLLALAYLRLAEQENCTASSSRDACLFPLRGGGIHRVRRGADGAVQVLTQQLARMPADTESQWLLNIAYMQLGEYPAGVPARWRIGPEHFASEAPLPVFPQVAASEGLDVMGHAGGVVVEDFDGDGLLDVLVTSSGPTDQMHLFHNNGNGTFRDVTRSSGLIGETGGLNVVLTDYDNDGHPDLLVLRGGWWGKEGSYPMSLLHNRGNGTFEDVTEKAGLLLSGPTQTAAWADYDGDGWLDLFVGYESKEGDRHRSRLFHNNHDGTFTDVSEQSGIGDMGFVKGVAWGDFNNDGRPDLYVSVMNGKNRLLRNDGARDLQHSALAWRFTDVAHEAGVDKQNSSFATWFFDYDNDGWPDIFVAGYSLGASGDVGAFEMGRSVSAEKPRLYRNLHNGTFEDVTPQTHLDRAILTMGANFGDLDNDGWLDVYLGTGDSTLQALLPNRMFRNDHGLRFQDVTTAGNFGHLQKGHAIAFADLHRTGFEDVFEEMGGAQPADMFQSALYRNPGNANHWITLRLRGTHSNRAAFGAKVDVVVADGHGAKRHIYRTVGFGSSFGGNPLEQHVGIGRAATVNEVRIWWPGSTSPVVLHGFRADTRYVVTEGADHATELLKESVR